MDKLKALGRGTQLMFVAAVLLIIDSFFHWQSVDTVIGSFGQNALHGFWGWVMFLLTIILIARIAARLAAVDVPIPLSFATTSFVLGILIAICAILKNLTDDYSSFWSYIGAGLAILVVVGAWLEVQEAGGVEHLKSQVPNSAGGATSTPAAAAPGEASAAAPSTPPPPAAESPAPSVEVEADAVSEGSATESHNTTNTPSNEQGT